MTAAIAGTGTDPEITLVETTGDLAEVQRLKYRVFVGELGRSRGLANHEARLLVEPDDAPGRFFQARVGDKLVGAIRLTWGGDDAIGQRHVAQYDLAPFLATLPPEQIAILERLMIEPEYRGTGVQMKMFSACMEFVAEHRIQLVFGDCEPHLANTYQEVGFRTYTDRNVSGAETGYLIPMVLVAEDHAYLRQIGSALSDVLRDYGDDARVPNNIGKLLASGASVKSSTLVDPEQYLADIRAAAREADALASGLFKGMSESEIAQCVERSITIACRPGDGLVNRGNLARNMGMVLSGEFEVRVGGSKVAVIGPGEAFGEIAFFLKLPRTMDMVATAGSTRIVLFNDRTLRSLIESHSETAAKLLYNISVMLCARPQKTRKRL